MGGPLFAPSFDGFDGKVREGTLGGLLYLEITSLRERSDQIRRPKGGEIEVDEV